MPPRNSEWTKLPGFDGPSEAGQGNPIELCNSIPHRAGLDANGLADQSKVGALGWRVALFRVSPVINLVEKGKILLVKESHVKDQIG